MTRKRKAKSNDDKAQEQQQPPRKTARVQDATVPWSNRRRLVFKQAKQQSLVPQQQQASGSNIPSSTVTQDVPKVQTPPNEKFVFVDVSPSSETQQHQQQQTSSSMNNNPLSEVVKEEQGENMYLEFKLNTGAKTNYRTLPQQRRLPWKPKKTTPEDDKTSSTTVVSDEPKFVDSNASKFDTFFRSKEEFDWRNLGKK